MLKTGDPIYSFDSQFGVHLPIEGKVLEILATEESPKVFDVTVEMNLPWDDGFRLTKFRGKYTPGATTVEGGSEYVAIPDTVRGSCRLNSFLYADRVFNLQLCLQQSVLFVNNAKYFTGKILKELRGLGQQPPSDIVKEMNSFGLK